MSNTSLIQLSLSQASQALRQGETSSVALTEAVLSQISQADGRLQAFLHVSAEQALAQATSADQARQAGGTHHPLLGIPLAIKDILCLQGMPATAGSRILQGYRPVYDATAVTRLRQAGAVFVGKTNTDEFAMGSSTENSAYQVTRNPHDLERVPGGSSGGSAVAVAAHMAFGALGTDTGGSVRQPASLCGVVGFKPSYGRVSRWGVIAFASSLDQVGPIGRTVDDVALLFSTIAGHDPLDSTTAPNPVPDFTHGVSALPDLTGVRVGVPRQYFIEGIQPEVEAAVRRAIEHMRALGATLVDVDLPHTEYALPTYYIIAPAEASANLARYDGVRFGSRQAETDLWALYEQSRGLGFGAEVKRRIMLGTYTLSAGYYDAYYLKAQQVRTLIKRDFEQAFQQVDVMACPTAPTTAFKLGSKTNDPLQMYLEDIFTLPASLAGVPAISLPCETDSQGLPIGLQLIGSAFGEARLLPIAKTFELTYQN
ncbi:MAG TPA: Asp-tRNA(Asn)/Glu-tRNA(Gln) amidotransferase subunit GatA [Anaerolineales bacterium]|nr:Asp-tRNA(Asn)/Glu-tRNA(Gln) amidotransferase subunit GatA [Anaerolineales bacterium]